MPHFHPRRYSLPFSALNRFVRACSTFVAYSLTLGSTSRIFWKSA